MTLGPPWVIQDCPSQDPSLNPISKVPFLKYCHIHRVPGLGHGWIPSGAIIQPSIWSRMPCPAPRQHASPVCHTWMLGLGPPVLPG